MDRRQVIEFLLYPFRVVPRHVVVDQSPDLFRRQQGLVPLLGQAQVDFHPREEILAQCIVPAVPSPRHAAYDLEFFAELHPAVRPVHRALVVVDQGVLEGLRRQCREHASDEFLRVHGADAVRYDLVVEKIQKRTDIDELLVAAWNVGDVRGQLPHRRPGGEIAPEDVRRAVLLQHFPDRLVVVCRMLSAPYAGVDAVLFHQPVDALAVDPCSVAQDPCHESRPRLQQAVVDLSGQAFYPVGRGNVPVVLDVAHETDKLRVALGLCRRLERAVIGASRNPGNAAGVLDRAPVGNQRLNGG